MIQHLVLVQKRPNWPLELGESLASGSVLLAVFLKPRYPGFSFLSLFSEPKFSRVKQAEQNEALNLYEVLPQHYKRKSDWGSPILVSVVQMLLPVGLNL